MSFTPPPGPGPYPGGPNNPEQYGQPGGPPPQGPGAPPPLPGDGLPPSSGGPPPPSSGGALPPLPGDNAPYSSPPGPPGYPDQTSPYGFDPAMSGPPAGGPPGYDPTGMYGPRPPGPDGMPPPPPPPKSHTGMIIGIVAGVVGLFLVLGIGGVALGVHLHNSAKAKASELSASASAARASESSAYSYDSESPTPSPSATARDASTLDDESTDETPFEMSQFFPNTIGSYTLAADGSFSACDDSGGSATQSLMNEHGCGDMATASYLDSGTYLASALVIPLTSSDDADAVVSTFKKGGEAFTGLRYFCPKSGTGSSICDAGHNPRWYAWYVAYHRYVLVTTILRMDGGDTDGSSSAAKSFATDVLYGIEDQMLLIQD